eukprot:UN01422
MKRDEPIHKYVGKNEKLKQIIKITKNNKSSAPADESPIDEATHKRMMAYWHKNKKQKRS